jgi:secreted trypsin-like serine protease
MKNRAARFRVATPAGRSTSALLAFALVGCAGGPAEEGAPLGIDQVQIIGGVPVPDDQAGFVAALFQDFGGQAFQICGGTFIAADLVLTAAHCSRGVTAIADEQNQMLLGPTDPALLKVVRRPTSVAGVAEADFLAVERVYVHPDYDDWTADNDIAVWRLTKPSPGPTLAVASPTLMARLDHGGALLTAFGYGVTNLDANEPSDVLMQVRLPLFDHEECRTNYYDALGEAAGGLSPEEIVTDNMLCAGGAEKDTCYGDSGGPLTFGRGSGRRIVGLTSWGLDCAMPGLPGVYTRSSNFIPWIDACRDNRCDHQVESTPACLFGFTDCDGDPSNGCESNTLGASHCGACGAACDSGEACVYDPDLGEPSAHCSPARALRPRVECIYDPGDGSSRIAALGYANQNAGAVFVRRGPSNRFSGVPGADETLLGFPGIEEFRPGRYGNAPIVPIGSGPMSWSLLGPDGVERTARVTRRTPICAENPLDQAYEQPKSAAERRFRFWQLMTHPQR